MKRISVFVVSALFYFSLINSALVESKLSKSDTDILIDLFEDDQQQGGVTLPLNWLYIPVPTKQGCLVFVYHLPEEGLLEGESPGDYLVTQVTIPTGTQVGAKGVPHGIMCDDKREITLKHRR